MPFSKASNLLHSVLSSARILLLSSGSKLQDAVFKLATARPAQSYALPFLPFGRGEIRVLDETGKTLFRDHLMRLDPETRRSRFAMPASDSFLQGYVETSFTLDTLIFAYFEDGLVRATAELRSLEEMDLAEAAFCVERDWRRAGLGSALMMCLLKAARNRGIRHIYINCLATNRHMQALARKFSAEMTFEAGDVIGRLVPLKEKQPSVLVRCLSRLRQLSTVASA